MEELTILGRLSPSAKVVEHTSIKGSWEQDSACLGFLGEMASSPAGSQQVREGKKGNQSKGSGCTVAQRCDKSLGWGQGTGSSMSREAQPEHSTAGGVADE